MFSDVNYIIVIVLSTVAILVCSIGVIISIRFQKKQKKKFKELTNLINQNKDAKFNIKEGLSKEEINKLDSSVDVDNLMRNLYNIYLDFENKIKTLNNDFDDILTGNIKDFNISRIELFKQRNFIDVTDGIELINYSIIEYNKNSLKFRVTINCFSYKLVNDRVVSGSNLEKIEKIILLDYEKIEDKWLISNYDKIYEKKLSN